MAVTTTTTTKPPPRPRPNSRPNSRPNRGPKPKPEPQAEEEQAQTTEALKIGFLSDFSGPLAEFGPVIQTGVELAIKHINDAGGVFGRPVSFVIGDTQVDTTQGLEEARRLIEIEGVHAIVGPLSSTISIAVAESVTGPGRIPTISPSATSPAVSVADDDGYLFRSTISDAAPGGDSSPASPPTRATTTWAWSSATTPTGRASTTPSSPPSPRSVVPPPRPPSS